MGSADKATVEKLTSVTGEAIWSQRVEAVYEALDTSPDGLSEQEVVERRRAFGPNELEEVKKASMVHKFLANFYHLFAILLWAGGVLAFIGGMPELGWAIFGVIIINAIFSFWQEFKAEKATEALKQLLPPRADVIRESERLEIVAGELVPGDILVLAEGDYVPADARVVEEFQLRTNEATLTGESHPVKKSSEPFLGRGLGLMELPNLIFSGTYIVAGSGKAVVYATGMESEFGKIAYFTQALQEEQSPLQREMGRVTKLVAILAVGLGILFFALGTLLGMPFWARFLFAVGIIVANVPEGLLPTVTLSLALAVQRMAGQNALVKKLSSVEALGSTNVILTDKTGTLTQNEMTVKEVWAGGENLKVSGVGYEPKGDFLRGGQALPPEAVNKSLRLLFQIASSCNNARLVSPKKSGDGWRILGDPTEGALLVAAAKAGTDLNSLPITLPRFYELAFDSTRKRMSTLHRDGNDKVAYVKGAPQETVELCSHIWMDGSVEPLTAEHKEKILAGNDGYARSGLRVLALAFRELSETSMEYEAIDVEKDLTFVGLVAMMDPPRLEVEEAVKLCRKAGIQVVMITGDYGLTAESIARRVGIVRKSDCRIIVGAELNELSDAELQKEVTEHQEIIFARVSPEHKLRVVTAFKDIGATTAVTGDGVNDAPALKKADIGVAMGITGTDVAKEASEMILTDDNFASIVRAVEEGRAVYDNIRRFVTYIFASNIPEIVPFILMVVLGIPLPLTIIQILAIDLGTDIVPALALGTERPEPGVMERPPRQKRERMLNMPLLLRAYFYLGPIEALAAMAGFFFAFFGAGFSYADVVALGGRADYLQSPIYHKAITMSLTAIILTQIGNGFACRTTRTSVFRVGFFSNKLLLVGIALELALAFLFVYVPPFQTIVGQTPIGLREWLFLVPWIPSVFIADEIRKAIVRRIEAKQPPPVLEEA